MSRVGTGERTPSLDERIVDGDISWDNIVSQFIDSATSTTLIHDALWTWRRRTRISASRRRASRQRRHRRDRFDQETLAEYRRAALALFRRRESEKAGHGLVRRRWGCDGATWCFLFAATRDSARRFLLASSKTLGMASA